MHETFTGVGVALITPFNKDGTIDYKSLEKVLQYQLEGGVDYFVINGTTGEGSTIPKQEKDEILRFSKSIINGRKPIVYGIGGNDTHAVLDQIKNFDFNGINGILTVSPYYNKPTQQGIYKHYKLIAETSPVPVLLYNVPGRTASNITAETTLKLSEVDNIAGIKEASGDLKQCLEIANNKPEDFLLLSGDDMLVADIAEMGGKGVISVIANAYPKEFTQLTHLAMNGDIQSAKEMLEHKFEPINDLLYEESNPVGIKKVMELKGLCSPYVRLPLIEASEELTEKIKSKMA